MSEPISPDSLEEQEQEAPESAWPGDHTRDLWPAMLAPLTDGVR